MQRRQIKGHDDFIVFALNGFDEIEGPFVVSFGEGFDRGVIVEHGFDEVLGPFDFAHAFADGRSRGNGRRNIAPKSIEIGFADLGHEQIVDVHEGLIINVGGGNCGF